MVWSNNGRSYKVYIDYKITYYNHQLEAMFSEAGNTSPHCTAGVRATVTPVCIPVCIVLRGEGPMYARS